MNIFDESLQAHLNARGKLSSISRVPLNSRHDLSLYYTPGVGAVSSHLAKHPDQTPMYTNTHNSVAIVSDGSAVLGLGNIGPEGALPVMEGKAILFKKFADIDGVPIVLNTQDPDEIIKIVAAIAPSFGGINLEDIAAPNCFYIEEELKKQLSIPVMHDDQHGTAVVVLAGLINACRVTKRNLKDCKVVLAGAGAAGVAIAKIIYNYAKPNIVAVDSKGVVKSSRKDLNPEKQLIASFSTDDGSETLEEALNDADIFIGVTKGGDYVTPDMIRKMKKNPIVFALANPNPEIMPEKAKQAGAAVIATGRSDYPNQINNVLAFPGLFRGALDTNSKIEEKHIVEAAEALAYTVRNPQYDKIIPDPLEDNPVNAVAAVFHD